MEFQESERAVSREEGVALAKDLGSLFIECSAKTRANVEHCFEELALKVLILPLLSLYDSKEMFYITGANPTSLGPNYVPSRVVSTLLYICAKFQSPNTCIWAFQIQVSRIYQVKIGCNLFQIHCV